jgi:hypothetical protein
MDEGLKESLTVIVALSAISGLFLNIQNNNIRIIQFFLLLILLIYLIFFIFKNIVPLIITNKPNFKYRYSPIILITAVYFIISLGFFIFTEYTDEIKKWMMWIVGLLLFYCGDLVDIFFEKNKNKIQSKSIYLYYFLKNFFGLTFSFFLFIGLSIFILSAQKYHIELKHVILAILSYIMISHFWTKNDIKKYYKSIKKPEA